MTSIERTASARFKRLITARELHLFLSPTRDELEWAADRTDSDEHLLALPLMLKSYQRMGCFPKVEDIPEAVAEFVRRAVELPESTLPVYRAAKTMKNYRGLVRQRVGVAYDQARARRIAGEADAPDVAELRGCKPVKRLALVACLTHKARMRVRDDLATMFRERVALKIKKAKVELEEIRLAEREIVEALIGNYRTGTALKDIDEGGPAQAALEKAAAMTAEVRAALAGLDEQAPADEVARRLEGRVSPVVLALARAQAVQAGGFGAATKAVEGFGGFAKQTSSTST
ncbi:DUF4158 domain-containing protein [Streptomyces sp. NPDC002690]